MDITLSARLRELRAVRKYTQEQLALHLGVTIQAVSKWERGEGYPDIAMLPAIASFYNVSVDDLLGVDKIARQKKLDEYTERSKSLSGENEVAERVALWRKAYREFPNEPQVLHNLSFALRAEDIKLHSEEIILLAKRLLKESALSGEYFGAVNNLCYAYAALGDVCEAKRYAAMAGRYVGTENQLMIHILEGEDAAAFCRWNIETLLDLIATNAAVMLRKGTFTNEEKCRIGEQIIKLFATVYEDGNYGFYHCRLSKWYMRLAKWYAKAEKQADTLRCLQSALDHAAAYDGLEDGAYTALIVSGEQYHGNRNGGKQVLARRKEMTDGCFAFLNMHPAYQALLK